MEVYTTEPGVQVYTDNWADGYKGQLEQHSRVEAQFALKPNISPILPIAPTFRL